MIHAQTDNAVVVPVRAEPELRSLSDVPLFLNHPPVSQLNGSLPSNAAWWSSELPAYATKSSPVLPELAYVSVDCIVIERQPIVQVGVCAELFVGRQRRGQLVSDCHRRGIVDCTTSKCSRDDLARRLCGLL